LERRQRYLFEKLLEKESNTWEIMVGGSSKTPARSELPGKRTPQRYIPVLLIKRDEGGKIPI